MRKNQKVFIGKRGCGLGAEKYNAEKWEGNYFYAISLTNIKRLKRDDDPEIKFYICEGGHLQNSEIKEIKNLLEFTNKQLESFFN